VRAKRRSPTSNPLRLIAVQQNGRGFGSAFSFWACSGGSWLTAALPTAE
jgi:hypothetical protein